MDVLALGIGLESPVQSDTGLAGPKEASTRSSESGPLTIAAASPEDLPYRPLSPAFQQPSSSV